MLGGESEHLGLIFSYELIWTSVFSYIRDSFISDWLYFSDFNLCNVLSKDSW